MKKTASIITFLLVIFNIEAKAQIDQQHPPLLIYQEVPDSSNKIYLFTYTSQTPSGNTVLTKVDSSFGTKFVKVNRTPQDTIREVYLLLGKKPFTMKYDTKRFRMVCIQKDTVTVSFWGIDTCGYRGIYFAARDNDKTEELYTAPPMIDWEEFSWETPESLRLLRFLLKYEFGKREITFDNMGSIIKLQIMVADYEKLRSP